MSMAIKWKPINEHGYIINGTSTHLDQIQDIFGSILDSNKRYSTIDVLEAISTIDPTGPWSDLIEALSGEDDKIEVFSEYLVEDGWVDERGN